MWNLMQDSRYGLRLLMRDPGFTLASVLTLALGIGANTAIFSVINGILLHPLPYTNPDRLVFLTEWSEQVPEMSFSVANFEDVRDQTKLFDSFVAYNNGDHVLTAEGNAERVNGRNVSSGMFPTLGVKPVLGRSITADDDKPGAAKVAMLGEGFWTRRFGRRPDVIGTQIVLSDESYTVIGIVPGKLHGSWAAKDVFLPLMLRADQMGGPNNRGNHPGIYVIGRLKPEVSVEQGREEVVALARGLAEKYPDSNAKQSMTVQPLTDAIVGDVKPALVVLLLAVAFVLLIACANVANLLLGRAAARQRELAVRAAMGASRARVIRQLLTESVILASVGGALGLLFAYWGVAGLLAWIPANTPRIDEVRVDGMVLLFTGLITLLTGFLFGLAPAWKISRTEPGAILKAGGRVGAAESGHRRLRSALVVAEVSLAIILLVGAGLMLRSFMAVLNADPGIRPQGVIVTQIRLPDVRYTEPERRRAFFDQVLEKARAVPGVRSAAATLPLLGGWQTSFGIEGRPEPEPGQAPSTDITRVSSDYFETMGVTLIKGRTFTAQDTGTSPLVCIVDETFVRAYWPTEDPLGKKIRMGGRAKDPESRLLEVVGVVRHVKNYGVDQPSRVETYVPYSQDPIGQFTLVVRSDRAVNDLNEAFQAAVRGVDPSIPNFGTARLDLAIEESYATRRISVVLLTVFAGLALVLAAVGIYGVISYSVAQRTQEIGIRMALGAEQRQILRMVMGQGTAMALLGIVIGLAAAFGLARLITTLLFQVSATDPPTFSAVPVLLLVVAMLAAYLPARRATRVEPMTALRDE